ncbi:MAG: hypothetical protein WAN20_06605 [Pseudonocardiaceae bacterium]|nr:hypothetical protein [Pseudonocardiaceae bacterium]
MSIPPWRRCVAVFSLAVGLILAVACSGPRSGASVTGGVSGCAAVLPLARHAVHDEGTLTLVRHISRADADTVSRKLGVTPTSSLRPPSAPVRPLHRPVQSSWPKACLVVYHGNYPAGTIAGASPPAVAGHYALIVLRVRHPSIVRILVTDTPPASLKL